MTPWVIQPTPKWSSYNDLAGHIKKSSSIRNLVLWVSRRLKAVGVSACHLGERASSYNDVYVIFEREQASACRLGEKEKKSTESSAACKPERKKEECRAYVKVKKSTVIFFFSF